MPATIMRRHSIVTCLRLASMAPMASLLRLRTPKDASASSEPRTAAKRSATAARGPRCVHALKVVGESLARPSHRSSCHRCEQTAPYGRPAHRLGDCAGRSPGSRVVACVRPSRFPSGQCGRRLAAHSCGGSHGSPRIAASVFPLSSPARTGEPAQVQCCPCRETKSSGNRLRPDAASVSHAASPLPKSPPRIGEDGAWRAFFTAK